jgi:protein-tyrosine phosphatase
MDFDQITEHLFVGGKLDGDDWKTLQELGVTVNLNLQEERQDFFDGTAPKVSLWLPVPDWFGPDVETIELGARFIASMVEAGHKVYVHCRFGAGRAPIVGAAYLVTTGLSADEALRLMKRGRPDFKPNSGQIDRLREFARKWERKQGT